MLERTKTMGWLLTVCILVGCESLDNVFNDAEHPDADQPAAEQAAVSPAQALANGDPPARDAESPSLAGASSDALDLSNVTWLHTNVSGWPETSSLKVRISGGSITLNYGKSRTWPTVNVGGTDVNANPWIFVLQGGRWYAATWEWLRGGQETKSTAAVSGSHIKKSPLENFQPVSGEVYGFMVSGLARTDVRNVKERSSIVMVRWP